MLLQPNLQKLSDTALQALLKEVQFILCIMSNYYSSLRRVPRSDCVFIRLLWLLSGEQTHTHTHQLYPHHLPHPHPSHTPSANAATMGLQEEESGIT